MFSPADIALDRLAGNARFRTLDESGRQPYDFAQVRLVLSGIEHEHGDGAKRHREGVFGKSIKPCAVRFLRSIDQPWRAHDRPTPGVTHARLFRPLPDRASPT
jgi:hypothetical protein